MALGVPVFLNVATTTDFHLKNSEVFVDERRPMLVVCFAKISGFLRVSFRAVRAAVF